MYERILVPLDGSSKAEIVFPYVEDIAAKLGSRIMLVSVSDSAGDVESLHRYYLERVKELVQTQINNRSAPDASKVETEALTGSPAERILSYAEKSDASLIVMASHGSSDSGPWLLGSIAAKVLRASARPQLLIRAAANPHGSARAGIIKRILVPLDGSHIGEAAVPYTEVLASALGAELVLYYVLEPPALWTTYGAGAPVNLPRDFFLGAKAAAVSYVEVVRKRLADKGLAVRGEVREGRPADMIINYAQSNSIDLIAMSNHGRSGIGRWVFGSVTDKVLHSGETAVLVIRAKP